MKSVPNCSYDDLIRALTATVEQDEQLIKDFVSATEQRFRGRSSGKTGRIFLGERGAVYFEGELFHGITPDEALDALEQRNAGDALSRETPTDIPEDN